MLKEMILLQSFGFVGGEFGNVLAQWEQLGVFSYLLPFLLIFALVFGILMKVGIFKDNKPINAVIALSVSLMSLQFGFVSRFFAEIFPRLGLGLVVILIALILLGLFMDTNYTIVMFIIGAIVLVIVLWTSFDFGTTTFSFWLSQNLISVIIITVILLLIGAMVLYPVRFPELKSDNLLAQALRSDIKR